MSKTTNKHVGYEWDARGRVVPAWVSRDIERLAGLMNAASPNEKKIARLRKRIEAQINAFPEAAKRRSKTAVATYEKMIEVEASYAALIKAPFKSKALEAALVVARAEAAAAEINNGRPPLPWDRRGRTVPKWAIRAVDTYRRLLDSLGKAERAAKDGNKRATARIPRLRNAAARARVRAEEMIEHGAVHAPPAARAKFTHYRTVMRDALAGYEATSGCSLAHDAYESLLKRHRGLIQSVVTRAKQRREVEDLEQQAFTALLETAAAYRMDHEKQAKLTTVAVWNMSRACETRSAGAAKPGVVILNNQELHQGSLDKPLESKTAEGATLVAVLPSRDDSDLDLTLTVREALSKLDADERAVAVAAFVERRSMPEIAAALSLTTSEVSRIRDRARQQLAELLGGLKAKD